MVDARDPYLVQMQLMTHDIRFFGLSFRPPLAAPAPPLLPNKWRLPRTTRGPRLRQHLLEARHPFTVPIQNQDPVEFGIKLLDAGDDASRSPEIAARPVCEGRRLRARGRKNFVEDIAQKLKILLGRHGTEPGDDIVLHGKLAEERNARRLRLGAEHFYPARGRTGPWPDRRRLPAWPPQATAGISLGWPSAPCRAQLPFPGAPDRRHPAEPSKELRCRFRCA